MVLLLTAVFTMLMLPVPNTHEVLLKVWEIGRYHIEYSVLYLIFSLLISSYLPTPILYILKKPSCKNNGIIISGAR